MNFLVRMLSGEGESNPSSKRVITLLAFLLMAVGFVAEIFFERNINHNSYESMLYFVLGGLGFTASEKFSRKEKTP